MSGLTSPRRSLLVRIGRGLAIVMICGTFAFTTPQDRGDGPSSVVPVARTDDWAIQRQNEVVARVRAAKSPTPIVFVGDSITQGWEGGGKATWDREIVPLAGAEGSLNLGVSGDRTEHVLWRLREAPLTPLAPQAIVVLIGTNNLGHGSSDADATLKGMQSVVATLRSQCPKAKIVLVGIFPRGERMNPMRGDICQINQVLPRLASENVIVIDFGAKLVRDDGTIDPAIMPDFLHLSPAGYDIWAQSIVPTLKSILKG